MATLSLNKMKSKLTTRNSFTGRAMERMTKEKLFELFNGDSNYMSWEETYIQRRFHPEQYLHKIRKQRRENFEAERNKRIMINNEDENLINLNSMLQNEEQHDIFIQERFENFISSHANHTSKPLLILDVDNTMIYVRFFSEELRIGDICTYFGANYKCVSKNNSIILKIRLTLSLEITHNELIDVFGSERGEHFYWTSHNSDIKKYKKNAIFEYPLNTNHNIQFIACRIRKVEISGVVIQVNNINEVTEEIEIDFTAANEDLNRFEPPLQRAGMLGVDFIYEGFLVRLRPNLDEFMEYIQDEYDVVLYTSANKIIYEGLLQQLHIFINETLGQESDILLWNEVLFREDCILKYDPRGKPYHQKDLTLFACDLSRVIIVDNSPIVCHGQEPNLILISDFFGKLEVDDELMEVYQLLDAIAGIEGDIRYFLCGLEEDESLTGKILDLSTEQKCFDLSLKLINAMKAYYNEQINVFEADLNGNMNVHINEDGMMDDFEVDEFKNRTENLLKYEEIFDDLQLNVITAVGDGIDEYEEIILHDMIDMNQEQKYERNSANFDTFIPPKHSKTDSIISVRDLDVIKQEKQEIKNKKNKVSFFSGTDFENKGKAAATPTRKRKRSSILNSMAPKPSSMQMLRNNSNHEDFFVLLLQQLSTQQLLNNKDIRMHIRQKNQQKILAQEKEIERLQMMLNELEVGNKEKNEIMEGFLETEKQNKHNDVVGLRAENEKLMEELKDVNRNIYVLTEHKNKLQENINHVIEKKIEYIKSVHDEIEHYKQLIKQIATNNLSVTLSVE